MFTQRTMQTGHLVYVSNHKSLQDLPTQSAIRTMLHRNMHTNTINADVFLLIQIFNRFILKMITK